MILYVVSDARKNYRASDGWFQTQKVLERLAHDVCMTLHYTRMSPKLVRELRPGAVVHSGGGTDYSYWEVKELGPDLRLLAISRDCRVQAFVHRSRPVYGTQFHPETPLKAYPDGFRVLRNFFRLARERT